MGKNKWGKLMVFFILRSLHPNGTNYNKLLLNHEENLWGKIMGKIYGEILWEKFMGNIYGKNLWEKLMGKINGKN